MNADGARTTGIGNWIGFALLVAAVLMIVGPQFGAAAMPIAEGTPLPELMAEGWLNDSAWVASAEATEGEPPPPRLAGRVVVMDCWASWCPPCRAAMPELVRLHRQYAPQGVQFMGLTPQSEREKRTVTDYMATVAGFDWPVGYGANPTLDMLGVTVFPTVVVFDTTGRVVWSGHHLDEVADVIERALAADAS